MEDNYSITDAKTLFNIAMYYGDAITDDQQKDVDLHFLDLSDSEQTRYCDLWREHEGIEV